MKKLICVLSIFDVFIAVKCMAAFDLILNNEIFITVYETKKVPYSLISLDDIKITWSTENTEIATITSKGTLKGQNVGKTKITASANGVFKNFIVFVKESIPCLDINYNSNTIFGFDPLSEYLIGNKIYLSDSDGKINIQNEWLGKTVEISKKNSIEECSSDKVSLFIEHTHNFFLFKTVTPTCLEKGYDSYKCICGETKEANYKSSLNHHLSNFLYDDKTHYQKCLRDNCDYTTAKNYHTFDNSCDNTCDICGFKRTVEHKFDNKCDSDCNICEYKRTVYHEFDNDCDEICNNCKLKRTVLHTFDNDCDTVCNICNSKRVAIHNFDNECDETCNICGYKRKTEHKYENLCDDTCNICQQKRNIVHSISKIYSMDETSHFFECKICSKIFNKEDHIFDNSCDTTCNICKFKRNVTHSFADEYFYNAKFHYNVCTVCKKKFNKTPHTYDDKYDSVCNICGFTRKLKANAVTSNNFGSYNKANKKSDNKVSEKEFYYNKNKINYPIVFIGVFTVIVLLVLLFVFKECKKGCKNHIGKKQN